MLEVTGMTGKEILAMWLRIFAAVSVFVVGASGLATAGPAEDYAEGMKWFNRGDYVSAIPELRKAADKGHNEAAETLAWILNGAEMSDEALKYYRQAAGAGNLKGMFGLAGMLAGDGGKKDFVEAKAWLEKAAERGYTPAISAMAQAYMLGELGIPEDQRKGKEALGWITRAADLGFVRAMELLEKSYRTGDYGLALDVAKADEWKKKIDALKPQVPKKRRRGESK
jgi:TPR repeat protein